MVNDNNRIGIWPGVLAGLSILTCYGTLVLVTALAVFGIRLNIHEGIWASVIVILAWAAVIAVVLEYRRLHAIGPLVVAVIGAILISAVMFISYNRVVEVSGFALILIAVIWNWRFAKSSCQK